MTRKSKKTDSSPEKIRPPLIFQGRAGLGAYIEDPASFPHNRVFSYTDKWVVVDDLYPKSSVHVLLLPRDRTISLTHPIEALGDPVFLAEAKEEIKKLRSLVAKELRRRYGKFSAQEQERERAMEAELVPDELPPGRDWDTEVRSGIHAHPSMDNLHIHVLSVDRVSGSLKQRAHYNSFATPFFIPLEAFPLASDDPRRHPGREGYLDSDLICWRCRKNFGNKFMRLKEHLAEEFEEWKRE